MSKGPQPSSFSEGGDPIYRYKDREKPFEPAIGDPQHIAAIDGHIERHLGKPDWVFHELISDLVHIDVQIIKPRPDRNFYTLITTGMSARAMKAPKGSEQLAYSELMLCLPPNWPLENEDLKNQNNYWPIRWLKMLARFPHEYDTWFCYSHTIPNGDPAESFAANTKLCGFIFSQPALAPREFCQFKVHPELTIHFYSLIPLYQEELDLKLKEGSKALFERLRAANINELLNVNRKNVARRKLFGFL